MQNVGTLLRYIMEDVQEAYVWLDFWKRYRQMDLRVKLLFYGKKYLQSSHYKN